MSTMTQPTIRTQPPAQLDSRMLAGGVDLNDYLILKERCGRDGEDWVTVAEELGDRHAAYAREQLALGHRRTAKYFFFAAASVYRVGQYAVLELTEERLRIYHKMDDAFAEFARLHDPAMTKVAIPYRDYQMEGWLLQPDSVRGGSPVVLMIPGATGFKEEFLLQAEFYVDRGVAVLLMDGPGQGTTVMFNKGYLEVEIEHAYSRMVDYLEENGFGPVGIIGGSTGGYYVSRAAATDPRIKACVWNSGSYYPEELCKSLSIYYRKFAILFGKTEEEMIDVWPKVTLEGLAERITCPFLVVHSESDPLFSLAGARRAFEEAKSLDKELKTYPGTNHCQGGAESEAFRYMADWMIDRLNPLTRS